MELSDVALTNKLEELQLERQLELDKAIRDSEAKAREQEVALRQPEEENFYKNKEDLIRNDQEIKKGMIEKLIN